MTDRTPLNIPSGNSRITPDTLDVPENDKLTGDKWTDFKRAFERLGSKDFDRFDKIPCIRTSLLYGIGAGVGLGAVRIFGSGRIRSAMNWGFGSFMVVSIFQWQTCRSARANELRTMRQIQDKYKHVSTLERKS